MQQRDTDSVSTPEMEKLHQSELDLEEGGDRRPEGDAQRKRKTESDGDQRPGKRHKRADGGRPSDLVSTDLQDVWTHSGASSDQTASRQSLNQKVGVFKESSSVGGRSALCTLYNR
ncbi:hypothetical protein INR49_007270 [Caranx melampygus]|nr:hypothetical protein INR49_007270 [Caranx melampygus]